MKKLSYFLETFKEKAWLVLILVAFAVVFHYSLTFVYVEGDDATSLAYHLLGRNSNLQPVYEPYQAMMDVFLGILPAREDLLRITSLVITSFAAVTFFVLLFILVFQLLRVREGGKKLLLVVVLLLAIPEFFYLGLVYSPSNVAMCLLLGSHLLLPRCDFAATFLGRGTAQDRVLILVSVILFGVGVACRWNTVVYGIFIAADLMVNAKSGARTNPASGQKLATVVMWGSLAMLSSAAFVFISVVFTSGFSFDVITSMIQIAHFVASETSSSGIADKPPAYLFTFARLSSLFTPAFISLAAIGIFQLFRKQFSTLILVLSGILGILPWLQTGVPKLLITAVPALAICVAAGFLWLLDLQKRTHSVSLYFVIGSLLVAPWVLGLSVSYPGSAWGPGFQLRAYDRDGDTQMRIAPVLGSGAAIWTPEGPRPLFGHAAVLLGGEWRDFVTLIAEERHECVVRAIETGYPLLYTAWAPSYAVNDLVAAGFTTVDSNGLRTPEQYFEERIFETRDGRRVDLLGYELVAEATTVDLQRLSDKFKGSSIVLYGNTRTLKGLYVSYPEALHRIGPTSAVLDTSYLEPILERH